MYIPDAFREDDLPAIHAAIERIQLATLVTLTGGGLFATHLPFLLDAGRGEYGCLYGHVARGNQQWRESSREVEALAIFTADDAYVTPNWHPSKQETGRVVPTWFYTAIHVYGTAEFIEDPEYLRDIVTRLTDKHEAAFPAPWAVTDAPADYVDAQLKRIVAIELPITRIEGKWKYSQRTSAKDSQGVLAGLECSEASQSVARVVRELEARRR